eukprot:TRINITY_DN34368_c0_g1_i1.p1 TRINITY_DN34368_c0_g1~~TRINITY_DN34368_c0_g1_i1.p1  ORF type:complete len:647 (+),score=111.90 TRINITY_DN34368_c0_g1_i1:242-2182(+)
MSGNSDSLDRGHLDSVVAIRRPFAGGLVSRRILDASDARFKLTVGDIGVLKEGVGFGLFTAAPKLGELHSANNEIVACERIESTPEEMVGGTVFEQHIIAKIPGVTRVSDGHRTYRVEVAARARAALGTPQRKRIETAEDGLQRERIPEGFADRTRRTMPRKGATSQASAVVALASGPSDRRPAHEDRGSGRISDGDGRLARVGADASSSLALETVRENMARLAQKLRSGPDLSLQQLDLQQLDSGTSAKHRRSGMVPSFDLETKDETRVDLEKKDETWVLRMKLRVATDTSKKLQQSLRGLGKSGPSTTAHVLSSAQIESRMLRSELVAFLVYQKDIQQAIDQAQARAGDVTHAIYLEVRAACEDKADALGEVREAAAASVGAKSELEALGGAVNEDENRAIRRWNMLLESGAEEIIDAESRAEKEATGLRKAEVQLASARQAEFKAERQLRTDEVILFDAIGERTAAEASEFAARSRAAASASSSLETILALEDEASRKAVASAEHFEGEVSTVSEAQAARVRMFTRSIESAVSEREGVHVAERESAERWESVQSRSIESADRSERDAAENELQLRRLAAQIAASHGSWADDVERLHSQFLAELANGRGEIAHHEALQDAEIARLRNQNELLSEQIAEIKAGCQ